MALSPSVTKKTAPKFPETYDEARKAAYNPKTFPNDLFAGGRNYATSIGFVKYNSALAKIASLIGGRAPGMLSDATSSLGNIIGDVSGFSQPSGSVFNLPIPTKINDSSVFSWSETSATRFLSQRAQGAASGLNTIAGIAAGVAINPFLIMYFQRPNFRQFTFQWTLPARTPQESQTIKDIVNELRNEAAPQNFGTIGMGYPSLAIIRFLPNDVFGMLTLKPCAILNVTVDHTPAGPSFFRDTNAPTTVNLAIVVQETEIKWRGDYGA